MSMSRRTAHRKRSLHGVNEYFEHRATQELARAGGFAKPSISLLRSLCFMAVKRMVVEMGMGTDLQGQDYTKASVRALKDALWHNSLSIAPAFGFDREEMMIEVSIGVAKPEQVDTEVVKRVLPYGKATVKAVEGGLDILSDCKTKTTVIANAAVVVYFDFAEDMEGDVA